MRKLRILLKHKAMSKKKKKPGVIILMLCIAIAYFAIEFYPVEEAVQADINLSKIEIPAAISGRAERVITHRGYTVSYNCDWKIPNWVAYEITDYEVDGNEERSDKFVPDPMVPKNLSATTNDYKNSGYDRGHMAPAADMKWDEQAMKESFYLSNICPQLHNLNAGVWKDLEEQVRDLAAQKGSIYVVCGPIVSTDYQTIGENNVAVPSAFFKVLLQKEKDKIHTIGFVYENKSGKRPMSSYARTVDEIEEITGIDFFATLPDEIENKVEAEVDFSKWAVSKK